MSNRPTSPLAIEVQRLRNHITRLVVKCDHLMPLESRTELTLHPSGNCAIRVINGTSSYMWYAPTPRQGWRIASHLVRWHAWVASDVGRAYSMAKLGMIDRTRQYDPYNEGDIPF